MSARQTFDRHFGECPLIAIIRGVTPPEAEAIGRALHESGIRIIEVPLNSPDPFASIQSIAAALGEDALIGAGTVTNPTDVARVKDAGGRIVVSPNTNRAVIAATVEAGLVSCPGFFTPSEAFDALDCGAHALKLFPAEGASPMVVKSIRAVLPNEVPLLAVGGISADSMQPWLDSGANGFGLGSALYKPGQTAAETLQKARTFVESVRRR